MKWSELRSACRRQSDYIITLFITNEISLVVTWALLKTRVTPNQVTIASICCAVLCGIFYALGSFLTGSGFLFFSHILDCTDGNLARATKNFSPLGKWLDMIGDRFGEMVLFMGVALYFYRNDYQSFWVVLSLIDALLLIFYYYIVDICLAHGLAEPQQELTSLAFKGIHVKWGLFEPVLYGFIVLAPLGLIKVQVLLVFFTTVFGLGYQLYKNYSQITS